MRNDRTGGPAFPGHFPAHGPMDEVSHWGMSLRDWFAGMALQTLTPKWSPDTTTIPSGLALYAYEIADAMLKEREKS